MALKDKDMDSDEVRPAAAPIAPVPAPDVLARVVGLKVNRASGTPARYQPIVLLWAIGRARRGAERLLSWAETETAVKGLLERYGGDVRPRPDYPVAALHRAGLWDLPGHEGNVPTAHGDSRPKNWFAENAPASGLTPAAYDAFRISGETRLTVIEHLVDVFFEGTEPEPLLTEVGLYDAEVADDAPAAQPGDGPEEWLTAATRYERLCREAERRESGNHGRRTPRTVNSPLRSAWARLAVLDRSEGRCENPACPGQPGDVTDAGLAILEVDHVVELALGGRDHPRQMVALCPNCHAVKTRGRTRETLRETLLRVALERHSARRLNEQDPNQT